ncbi:DNA-binding transcriptional repressor ExuR [Escherichia coli]|nr:DNA-binding transcriptional repressor ExuR [Escherichia coli]
MQNKPAIEVAQETHNDPAPATLTFRVSFSFPSKPPSQAAFSSLRVELNSQKWYNKYSLPYHAWSAYGITEPRRLYQQLAADLKERIEQGVYLVGDKLPAERFIADEKNVSRTVVREAIIMLEVEGYVEVRKGSGIHVVSNQPRHQQGG